MTQTKTKPVHSIRYGNIRAAIWRNDKGFHNVTFERSYMKDEEWKTSDSFGRDDLPKLSKAADEAYAWIFQNSKEVAEASDE